MMAAEQNSIILRNQEKDLRARLAKPMLVVLVWGDGGFACLSEIWKLGRRVERGVSMFLLYALLLCRQLKWCYELMEAGIGTITFTAEHNSTAPYSSARTYITQHNITSSWAFIAPRLALSPQSANELRPA
jgi:hypothetical protein